MTYTGNVTPGVPAMRKLSDVTITKVSVGPLDNNAYLLRDRVSSEGVLIDAANDADVLRGMIGDTPLRAIITTHRHFDHWQALPDIAKATGAEVVAHRLDADELPIPAHRGLEDRDVVPFGGQQLRVIHIGGHTPGSACFAYEDSDGSSHLFTGDCLFRRGIGNTWGNMDNLRTLISNLERKVFDVLPDSTWVYPGHGPDTTLGEERENLTVWKSRISDG